MTVRPSAVWRRVRWLLAFVALCTLATCPAAIQRCKVEETAREAPTLLGYLVREFGVRPAASHDPQAVAAGEAVYKEACRTCHDDGFVEQQRLDAAAWGREVDKMVRWGARVSADEKPGLVAFLTSRWGR